MTFLPVITLIVGILLGIGIAFWIRKACDTQVGNPLEAMQAKVDQREAEIKVLTQKSCDLSSELASASTNLANAQESNLKAQSQFESSLEHEKQRFEAQLTQDREASAKSNQALMDEKDKNIAHERELLEVAEAKLKDVFEALSANALKKATDSFLVTAKETFENSQNQAKGDLKLRQQQIEELLKPLRETVQSLDKRIEETDKERANGQVLIEDHINQLMSATTGLTSAFKKPITRGGWGEYTLQNLLEGSGLLEGIDYVLQHSTDAEDGRLRADAVVNMPNGNKIVIDSKNIWENYTAAQQEKDEDKRNSYLLAHAAAVRNQIKLLSDKNYAKQYDGVECVIMFLPTEALFQAAIENDPGIIADMHSKNVILANPMTLIGLLKAVQFVLTQEKQNKNTKEISDLGQKLYEGVRTFAKHYLKLGNQLDSALSTYNDSVGSLEKSIVSRARNLKEMGAGSVEDIVDSTTFHTRLRAPRTPELAGSEECDTLSLIAPSDPIYALTEEPPDLN